MTTRQNINIDTLEGFRTFLNDNPDKGKLHLEVKGVYEGQAGRSMIHVGRFAIDDTTIDRPTRHYTFPFGAWREVEDMIGMEGAKAFQNINIDTLEGFRTFLNDNPDKGKLHLEVKGVYEGQAGRSMIHVGRFAIDDTTIDRPTRHYTFPFGAWREVEDMIGMEGATDRMEPVEMALASTAACLINSITLNAARPDLRGHPMRPSLNVAQYRT